MKRLITVSAALMLATWLSGAATLYAQGDEPSASAKPTDLKAPVAPAAAQEPAVAPDGQATATPKTTLPVNLDHIKREAQQQPAVRLDDQQLRFYVLVLGKEQPKFMDFIGNYDLMNGPTKGGAPMTHQEFLNMVTPKELNELFGATSSSSFAMFQAAVMNAAAQSLIKRGLEEIRHARNEREVQAIRDRIDRELAALLGKN